MTAAALGRIAGMELCLLFDLTDGFDFFHAIYLVILCTVWKAA